MSECPINVEILAVGTSKRSNVEIAKEALQREYFKPPVEIDEDNDVAGIYLDGRFSAEELKSIAWCMEHYEWPIF